METRDKYEPRLFDRLDLDDDSQEARVSPESSSSGTPEKGTKNAGNTKKTPPKSGQKGRRTNAAGSSAAKKTGSTAKKAQPAAKQAAADASAPKKRGRPAGTGKKTTAEAGQPKRKYTRKKETSQQAPKESADQQRKTVRVTLRARPNKESKDELKIIPLGGLGEIGKNMTVYECGDTAIIVDCGMSFPDDELFGVNIVIPDFSYINQIRDKVKALFVTHGHEDHIGGIPYLLKEINVPIYGTKLTNGLISYKLEEAGILNQCNLREIKPGDIIVIGNMAIEPIAVNHSIPDSVAFAITTPQGVVVHTGDFKIDFTPVQGKVTDLHEFARIGDRGVLALLSDSTNAERPGTSMTESKVGQSFENVFNQRCGGKRAIIATFSSNIQRIQQILNLAERHGRKVAILGRSMLNYSRIAAELGYLDINPDVLISADEMNRYRPGDLILITTGTQGEPMAALSRMAQGIHKQVKIGKDDVIIISARPIPGNEKEIGKVVNDLLKLGADVIYESMYEVHASGHACADELKLMMTLVKPKYFMPVHGEYKHQKKNAGLARSLGFTDDRIIIAENGDVIKFRDSKASKGDRVRWGQALIDSQGTGDIGSSVIRERKRMAEDGVVIAACSIDNTTREIIAGPDIIMKGIGFEKESGDIIMDSKNVVLEIMQHYNQESRHISGPEIKSIIKRRLGELMYSRTGHNPIIIVIIMDY
ncbi:MAG: ribonuclease J [Oscillospiraceae bacterium]